jgi:hypothetical protein
MSYKPGANDLPMMKLGPEPLFLQEYTGRWFFLEALQIAHPKFWSDLRDLHGEPREIETWRTRSSVVDEWFIDVIWETAKFWSDNPTSPRTQLAPGCRWFRYPILEDARVQIPLFAPRVPVIPDTSTGTMESPDDFESRARAEFESQLKEYVRYLRSVTGEDHTELRQHAQWTAMAFAGASYVNIASQFRHLHTSMQPDMTVKMAIRRFSDRIGLTLPRRRRSRT